MNQLSRNDTTKTPRLRWLPLARRILGWGLMGLLRWFVAALLLIVAPTFAYLCWWERAYPTESQSRYAGLAFMIILYGALLVVLLLALLGAVAGAVAGLCAPPNDVKNPLRSPFFRRVQRESASTWLHEQMEQKQIAATSLTNAETKITNVGDFSDS